MRHPAILSAALVLAACAPAPVKRGESGTQAAALDSTVEFLIAAAAADFHDHRPPDPTRFREVHIGHVMTSHGETQYLLCGEFLPAQEQDGAKAEWTPFATIKTSPYEHWIGPQAAGLCRNSAVAWDKADDLSSALQSRLDSLR